MSLSQNIVSSLSSLVSQYTCENIHVRVHRLGMNSDEYFITCTFLLYYLESLRSSHAFPRLFMHNGFVHAVSIKFSPQSPNEAQHDISPLCLGKNFISLLRSNVTKALKVKYESRLCANIQPIIMAHEAVVSLSSNDGMKIMDVKSKSASVRENIDDVDRWDFQVSAALENLGENDLHPIMRQVETDLRCWCAMHSIPQETASEGGIVIPGIECTLLNNSLNFLSLRDCTNPRDLLLLESASKHTQHATDELLHRICSTGVSSGVFVGNDGRAWLAASAILCNCKMTLRDLLPCPVQLVSPSHFVASINIVGALQKCSWSRKAGFRFRSRKGSIVSISKRSQTLTGKHQYAHVSGIYLAFIPAVAKLIPESKESMDTSTLLRSATNAAIDDLHRQLAAESGPTQKLGTGSVDLLVDSLVGKVLIDPMHLKRSMTDSRIALFIQVCSRG